MLLSFALLGAGAISGALTTLPIAILASLLQTSAVLFSIMLACQYLDGIFIYFSGSLVNKMSCFLQDSITSNQPISIFARAQQSIGLFAHSLKHATLATMPHVVEGWHGNRDRWREEYFVQTSEEPKY